MKIVQAVGWYFPEALGGTEIYVAALCRAHKALFLVNDRADMAALLGAGLHVGQDDLAPADARRIIGAHAVLGSGRAWIDPQRDIMAAMQEVEAGKVKALYLIGGYREPWITEAQAKSLAKLELLVVQDILPSPATALAKYVLPGGR